MHVEHKRLFNKKAMGDWAAEQGVDRAKFDSVFDSFSVQTQVQRADQLAQAYNIDGTPSFGVGGKYLTSPALAGNSYEGALDRKSVVSGKSVSGRVDLGGRRISKKKKTTK